MGHDSTSYPGDQQDHDMLLPPLGQFLSTKECLPQETAVLSGDNNDRSQIWSMSGDVNIFHSYSEPRR